jgi:hypothetical protein
LQAKLAFINNIFLRLSKILLPNQFKLLHGTIRSLLISFDSRYRNFLGELGILSVMIESKNFDLIQLEYRLPNRKRVDFKIVHKITREEYLVEILNFQFENKNIEYSEEGFTNFFTRRFNAKKDDKLRGLQLVNNFKIIPIFWGIRKDIELYIKFFSKFKTLNTFTLEPFAYGLYSDDEGRYYHAFSFISKIK